MLWKVFDFVTLGTFENNMNVPAEQPTNASTKAIVAEEPKKHTHSLVQNSDGTIGLATSKVQAPIAQEITPNVKEQRKELSVKKVEEQET